MIFKKLYPHQNCINRFILILGLRWPCPLCTKVFTSRAGVARHRSIAHGPNRGRPRGRWANPYMASVRRRAKLKEVVFHVVLN